MIKRVMVTMTKLTSMRQILNKKALILKTIPSFQLYPETVLLDGVTTLNLP